MLSNIILELKHRDVSSRQINGNTISMRFPVFFVNSNTYARNRITELFYREQLFHVDQSS